MSSFLFVAQSTSGPGPSLLPTPTTLVPRERASSIEWLLAKCNELVSGLGALEVTGADVALGVPRELYDTIAAAALVYFRRH